MVQSLVVPLAGVIKMALGAKVLPYFEDELVWLVHRKGNLIVGQAVNAASLCFSLNQSPIAGNIVKE